VSWNDPETAPGNKNVRLEAVRIRSNGSVTRDILIDEDITIEIDYCNLKEGAILTAIIFLRDKVGSYVLASNNSPSASLSMDQWFGKKRPNGVYRSTCVIPANFLNNDNYSIDVGISNGRAYEAFREQAISFVVHETGEQKREYSANWGGVVRPKLGWSTEYLSGDGS
jgi:lipopolysaccharide transport system ATP-binding protein